MIDLAVSTGLEQLFMQPITPEDPDAILPFLRHRRSVMTFSDSGAHVSQIMDSSIQTHLLAYWVRQRQDLALEEAVRMLTSATADAWGFTDRGRLRTGMAADLNVFDPDTVAPSMPEVATDLPGGARRPAPGGNRVQGHCGGRPGRPGRRRESPPAPSTRSGCCRGRFPPRPAPAGTLPGATAGGRTAPVAYLPE